MPDSQGAQRPAWISSTAPLEVVVAGATVACPAETIAGHTYSVGDAVQVTLRNPSPPLVQGVVSS